MNSTLIVILCLCFNNLLFADVKGTGGQLKFDVNSNGTAEAILSTSGFGIGSALPSANLSVAGNALISNQLTIGTGVSSSNLNINGSISFVPQTITSNTTLGDYSLNFVNPDIAGGNLNISLPLPIVAGSRFYQIKNLGQTFDINVIGEVDGQNIWKIPPMSSSSGTFKVISDGSQYHLLNLPTLATQSSIQSGNLLCWFKFEETTGNTVTDSGPLGNQGTLLNFDLSTATSTGKNGAGLEFEGTDDYITISALDSLNISQNDFTIMVWLKPESGSQPVFGEDVSVSSKEYRGDILSTGQVSYQYQPSYAGENTIKSIESDQWSHIAWVVNNTTLSVYINGHLAPLEGDGIISRAVSGNPPFYLGRNRNGCFNGVLDDFIVYNMAVSLEDIRLIMGFAYFEQVPSILSAIANDPDDSDFILSVNDTLTISFDLETNQPNVSTKNNIDALIDFGGNTLASDYSGIWLDARTLEINVDSGPGDFPIGGNIAIKSTGGLTSLEGAFASSASSNVYGHWGANSGNNLIAWLRLDEQAGTTAFGSGIVSHHGDLKSNNFSFSTNSIAGKLNDGLVFDGIDDYIHLRTLDSFNATQNVWTVMGWFKPNSGIQYLFGENESVNAKEWNVRIGSDGNVLYLYDVSYTTRKTLSSPITFNAWNHIACVIDQDAGQLKIVVNGVDEALDSTVISYYKNGDAPFLLGKDRGGLFKGVIDDFRLFDRVLSTVEIQAIYNEAN